MSEPTPGPLDAVRSIKTKLGLLVAVSVLLAVVLGIVSHAAGVQWWLSVPVAVVLSLAVTQLLAAGMVAPLRQMTQAARQMARGDYSTRVTTHASDEVGELASAFNQMAADLDEVEQSRRELIATVSHELRTPVTAITAQLENLADGVVAADPERLARLHEQSVRLGALVHDLLELSRLEAGASTLERQPVLLRALVLDCVATVEHARAATFAVEISDDLTVSADPTRLRQLLLNVLDNAARHSPAGEPVTVRAAAGPVGWHVEVVDHGPGVALADRERVFERFGTGEHAGGTGLGLAIARWVAQLHGGALRFVDRDQRTGAVVRLEVPHELPAPPIPGDAEMTLPTLTPTPTPTGQPLDGFWPEEPGLRHTSVLLAAVGVGVLGGAFLVFPWTGVMWTVVLLTALVAAFFAARHRRSPFTVATTGVAALLLLPLTLRDDIVLNYLGVLLAGAVFLIGITEARTVPGFILSGLAWPMSAIRGMPWLARSLRVAGLGGRRTAAVRTAVWSALGLLIFGALFASADALFASWVEAIVPNLTMGDLVARCFLGAAVFGLTLAAAYVGVNPPAVETALPTRSGRLANRFEWLVPVLVIDAVFVLFLIAQATAIFGGHAYLESTTGITYADYVHQGFGQLTVATALTLLVFAVASRWAGEAPLDRLWLRISLGLLGALTLVVVASALYRMHVYQQAYGFTVLRLVVDVFEGWLGLVIVATMVAGLLGWGRHLPRFAVLSAAALWLGLAVLNPNAWVANQNIDRYQSTDKLDVDYLGSLSADAAPTIAERLPADVATCVLDRLTLNQLSGEYRGDWRVWNLARHRALPVVWELGLIPSAIEAPESDTSLKCARVSDSFVMD